MSESGSGDRPAPLRYTPLMALIRVTPRVAIDETELVFAFARASGPGGQNVNKVESAVHLRFDVWG